MFLRTLVYFGYFYTDGDFSVDLNQGPTVVRVGHGFEFEELVDTVEVLGDTSFIFHLN